MTFQVPEAVALVAMGAKSTSAAALTKFFLPLSFLGGFFSRCEFMERNKSDKLTGRMQMKSTHDCKREVGH